MFHALAQRQTLAAAILVGTLLWAISGMTADASDKNKPTEKEADSGLIYAFGTGTGASPLFSPDGNNVLTVEYESHKVALWDATTGQLIRTFSTPNRMEELAAFSPDGAKIFSIAHIPGPDSNKQLETWDTNTAELLGDIPFSFCENISNMAFSLDTLKVLISGPRLDDKSDSMPVVELRSTIDGSLIRSFSFGMGEVLDARDIGFYHPPIAYSPDNKHVLASGPGTCHLYDADTGIIVRDFEYIHGPSYDGGYLICMALSPDGTKVLCAGKDGRDVKNGTEGTAMLWETSTGKFIRKFSIRDGWQSEISAAAFSPDGAKILTSDGGEVQMWEVSSGKLLGTFPVSAWKMTFSPDGARILLAVPFGATYLYDATELDSGGCAGCARAKSMPTLGGLKSRMGDLFLAGLGLLTLTVLSSRALRKP